MTKAIEAVKTAWTLAVRVIKDETLMKVKGLSKEDLSLFIKHYRNEHGGVL